MRSAEIAAKMMNVSTRAIYMAAKVLKHGVPELVAPESGWLVPAGALDPLVSAMRQALTLAPEALEALHDVLVTVLARLRRQDDLVDSVFLVAAQIVAHLPGRPHRPAQAPAVPLSRLGGQPV